MAPAREFVHSLADSRHRGLPPIGLRLRIPDSIETTPLDATALAHGGVLAGIERGNDGRWLGAVEIDVFAAGLMIDRERALERLARDAADAMIEPPATGEVVSCHRLELDSGPSGCRVEVALSRDVGAGRYVTVLALAAADLSVSGGVLLVARMLRDSWPALDELLGTLRIFGRGGETNQNVDEVRLNLPMLGRK